MSFIMYLLLIIITLFPKITIISVSNNSTGIRIEDLVLLVCIVLLFFLNMKSNNKHNINKIEKIMMTYTIISILSTIFGLIKNYVTPITSILFIIRRLEYFLLYYLGYCYAIKQDKNDNKYFDFIIIFHTFICILQMMGIVGSFNHGEKLSSLTQGRISSTFNGAYEMSAFLLVLLPYYIYNLIFQKKLLKNILYIILITFCIIVSASRSSLVIECLIFVYILINNNVLKNKKMLQNTIILTLFIVTPILIITIPKIDFSRYNNLSYKKISDIVEYTWNNRDFDNYVKTKSWYGNSHYSPSQMALMGYDDSLYVRVSHWMQLIDGWIVSPIIGVGVSIAGAACDGNYIKILVETGILGLSVWIYLICVIYKSLCNSKWLKYSFITIVLGATLIDLFDASKVMMFFWFLLGIYSNRKQINKSI